MATEMYCGWCGELFVKKGNQNYCCKEHSRLAKNQKVTLRNLKLDNVKEKPRKAPRLSIEDMVAISLKLSKERGRVVHYGEAQRELITGKLKIKDGVVL